MKIAIIGAHGVGKTTLAKGLSEKLNIPLIPDTAAEAFHKGFIVNENTPIENQFWILCKQIEYERERGVSFIADKALFDNIVYSRQIFSDERVLSLIEEIVLKNAHYDACFYIPIEIPLVADGRSIDIGFQKKIDQEYTKLMSDLGLNYYQISGSIEDRIKRAMEIVSYLSF